MSSHESDFDVGACPDCDTQGRYDGRVLLGGRGVYSCPACGTKWQDADETPSFKGAAIVRQREVK
jgi:ribosomal protein L37AE/L43A